MVMTETRPRKVVVVEVRSVVIARAQRQYMDVSFVWLRLSICLVSTSGCMPAVFSMSDGRSRP